MLSRHYVRAKVAYSQMSPREKYAARFGRIPIRLEGRLDKVDKHEVEELARKSGYDKAHHTRTRDEQWVKVET